MPWMKNEEILLLEKYLKSDFDILEYGSGSSTKWFADKCKSIVSIEHDKNWYEIVRNNLKDCKNAILHFVPPSIEWNSPTDGSLLEFEDYVNYPLNLVVYPNLVLIDGRARIDCCHFVAKKYPKSLIAFHDYFSRASDGFHDYSKCLSSVSIIDGISDIAIMESKFHE